MSQIPLAEKLVDERLLSTAPATEFGQIKNLLAQLRLNKAKLKQSGPFSLNVDYYFGRVFEKTDNITISTFTNLYGH